MTNSNPYKNFPNYVLRTPLFSVNSYKKLTSDKIVSDDCFKKYCKNTMVKEALFLASPLVFEELIKWLKGETKDSKKIEKLRITLLKYISRMSSRCTPFGLFAGCSVGKFGNNTNIRLENPASNKRHTRLDMNYLVALSKDLVKIKKIKNQLHFFPNSSIYKVGNQLRYIEYSYVNTKRVHRISAVDYMEYLEKIFYKASKGALLGELAETIIDNEITKKEAIEFIEELIDNQLLISELEPSVSGPEFLDQIISTLKKIDRVKEIVNILERTKWDLKSIDKRIGNPPKKYTDISRRLEKLDTKFELKYLFQTDMILNPKHTDLNKEIINDLKKGFLFLNKITLPPKNTLLTKYKDSFYERFEEKEVPLSYALDVEIGIGYNHAKSSGDINPLIDDIILPQRKSTNLSREVNWTNINSYFQKKLIKALKNNDYAIILNDDDFKNHEAIWDDLPDTLSFIIEKVEIDGKRMIKYKGGGGSSAANLFARFCHGDNELNSFTKKIIDFETKVNENKLLAEIVHLPESRVGNVLMRPAFRKYEIPYLAKSIKPLENQLNLKDLTISIIGHNKILLKSKKYKKEVIPRLTNAHNYSNNSLPIYNFLADLQNQHSRNGIGFNLGPFSNEYEFIPRIEYFNLVLHDATWNLQKTHLSELFKCENEDDKLLISLEEFRKTLTIPQFVLLVDGDNELLINLENLTSVRMFLDTIRNRPIFKLKEFLFENSGIVRGEREEYFTNQIIVSFYNEKKLKNMYD